MILLLLSACNRSDPSDSWTYGNQTTPIDGLGDGSGGGDDTLDTALPGDTGDTGGSADTGDTGTTGEPPEDGTGYGVGDTAYNLQGTSHTGAPWALYDQLGSPVVLLVGHLDLGTVMTDPLGFIGDADEAVDVALIGRDATSTASTADDAADAAAKYGVSTVLYDPSFSTVDLWSDSAAPKAYVIDGDMIIRWVGFGGSITESAIAGALEDL